MLHLEKILTKFEEIVSPNFCNTLAKKCKLVQRSTSQLQGYEFAQSIMTPNAFIESESLNSLGVRMQKINKACNLSAPALAQRINTNHSVEFMKACFGKVLKEIVGKEFVGLSDLPNLSNFNRVLIEDSTRIELHQKLSPYFKGSGGSASKSSMKIDYIFDYLSEGLVHVDIFSGNEPDQRLASRIVPFLEKNDLVIRDLGYYALDRLKEIEMKEAYYISRFKSEVLVYKSKTSKKPLNLAKFLDENMSKGIADVEVFIGKDKHPVRLVACELGEEAVNKRRRDANRSAQRHGTKLGKKKSQLLKYAIFITNIPASILFSISIISTYRARWRVELIFKQWKSCLKLHLFKGYKIERFRCLVYGRLIMILLLGAIFPVLIQYALSLGKELSCYKLVNYLIADDAFPRAFQEGKIDYFIKKLLADLPRRLCMDKRKRLSLRSNVRMGNTFCNELNMNWLNTKIA